MLYVIKANKEHQAFDQNKLYTSVYLACLSVQDSTAVAHNLAQKVTKEVVEWTKPKTEVSTKDIRKKAGDYLYRLHPHAGYLYLHHRII
jgi:transcriptional regulator NrdR family protein